MRSQLHKRTIEDFRPTGQPGYTDGEERPGGEAKVIGPGTRLIAARPDLELEMMCLPGDE